LRESYSRPVISRRARSGDNSDMNGIPASNSLRVIGQRAKTILILSPRRSGEPGKGSCARATPLPSMVT